MFVKSMRGEPQVPCSPRKARVLLAQAKERVVKRTPFTIQLTIATGEAKQDIPLGVDAGPRTIGISGTTRGQVLFEAEVEVRNDIVDLLATRRSLRRGCRHRKTRYRKPRFDNCRRPDI